MGSHSTSIDPKWDGYPQAIVDKILILEAELDEIRPGWRTHQRFDTVAYDLKARIKWCLKRHSLLTSGGPFGIRDWDVIVVRDGKSKTQCYAHPLEPVSTTPDSYRGKDSAYEAARDPKHSRPPEENLAALAWRLGVPIEMVEFLARNKPADFPGTTTKWIEDSPIVHTKSHQNKVDKQKTRKAKEGVAP